MLIYVLIVLLIFPLKIFFIVVLFCFLCRRTSKYWKMFLFLILTTFLFRDGAGTKIGIHVPHKLLLIYAWTLQLYSSHNIYPGLMWLPQNLPHTPGVDSKTFPCWGKYYSRSNKLTSSRDLPPPLSAQTHDVFCSQNVAYPPSQKYSFFSYNGWDGCYPPPRVYLQLALYNNIIVSITIFASHEYSLFQQYYAIEEGEKEKEGYKTLISSSSKMAHNNLSSLSLQRNTPVISRLTLDYISLLSYQSLTAFARLFSSSNLLARGSVLDVRLWRLN